MLTAFRRSNSPLCDGKNAEHSVSGDASYACLPRESTAEPTPGCSRVDITSHDLPPQLRCSDAVVPLPKKGSKTSSPGSVSALMKPLRLADRLLPCMVILFRS
jgi:hypothetical protein